MDPCGADLPGVTAYQARRVLSKQAFHPGRPALLRQSTSAIACPCFCL